MLKLIKFFLFIYILIQINTHLVAKEKFNCNWDNYKKTPCILIKKKITNTSEYSNKGIKKIIINKKQIEETGAVDLIDILKIVPGINITQSGPKGQQASLFMRGTGSNHTLVMINGVPINDQSTTQGLHDFGVDFIQTIQQIEIYPGSSATNFGANSIGGAINIILTGNYKDNYTLFTDENSNHELLINKNFLYGESSLNLKFGSVNYENISVRGKLDDETDGVKNNTININYQKYLTPTTRLHNTSYFRQTVAEYDNSITKQTGYKGDNKMSSIQFGIDNLTKDSKKKSLFYYNVYDREYDERGTIDTYKSEVIGLKYDYSKTLSKIISFGVGTEYKYDWGSFDNQGSYNASTKGNLDQLSIFNNIGLNLSPKTNLSLFLRNDKHKVTGNNLTNKINLNQNIGKFNFGISRMSGLRSPTLYDLYGTDNFGYSGNKNLKPEKSITNEIYGKYLPNKNLTLSTVMFRSNISNNIEYKSNKYVNDKDDVDLNQSGITNSLSFNSSKLNFDFFSSFLSSKKENGADQLRRPEKNIGINFIKKNKNKKFGEYNLGITYNHYGKHFDTHSSNFSTIQMDSTDLVELNLTKKFNNGTLYFKISNLLDETYQRPHGYNQEKRSIKIGFKY
jgi:vitamin B12 transporter